MFQGVPCLSLINCSIDYFNVFINKNFFTIRFLDTSRHSMEDVIRVIAITLETLLEDKENQIRYVVVLDFSSSFQGILFRGLSCIVDASNLSLAHMTFWNPIEVQNYKNWFNTIIAVKASDQPVREEHSHEAQGGQLHPPALLCQHHVQLCQGNPQQEDSEQVIFCCCPKYSRCLSR